MSAAAALEISILPASSHAVTAASLAIMASDAQFSKDQQASCSYVPTFDSPSRNAARKSGSVVVPTSQTARRASNHSLEKRALNADVPDWLHSGAIATEHAIPRQYSREDYQKRVESTPGSTHTVALHNDALHLNGSTRHRHSPSRSDAIESARPASAVPVLTTRSSTSSSDIKAAVHPSTGQAPLRRASSIVRAIDFAYRNSSPKPNHRSSSSSVSSFSAHSASSSSRRTSTSSAYSLSSATSEASSHIRQYASPPCSSSSGLYSPWSTELSHAIDEMGSLDTTSLSLGRGPSTAGSSSPASSCFLFSPMSEAGHPIPSPLSPYEIGNPVDVACPVPTKEQDDAEDLPTCYQPGCNTTITAGCYYCEVHDDPFGDD